LLKFRNTHDLKYANIDLMDVDFSSQNLNASMVLSFIEYHKGQGNLTIKSLEHILPQNPKVKQWPVVSGVTKDVLEDNIYSLGNMMLIDKPLNSKVKAASFTDKVKEYSKFKVFDPVGQSSKNYYENISNLGFKIISDRNQELVDIYKSIVN
jgi:hypothetical protein